MWTHVGENYRFHLAWLKFQIFSQKATLNQYGSSMSHQKIQKKIASVVEAGHSFG